LVAAEGGIGIAFVPVPCVLCDDSFLDGPKPLYGANKHPGKGKIDDGQVIQCNGEGLRLCFLYCTNFLRTLVGRLVLVAIVPMHVLVFLPPTCGGIDAVAKVVLFGDGDDSRMKKDRRETRTSLSLSAETSDHLNSAWPPRVPPRMGSNMTTVRRVEKPVTCEWRMDDIIRFTFSHGRTGLRQNPGDHDGKSREASAAHPHSLALDSPFLFLRQCFSIPFLPVS